MRGRSFSPAIAASCTRPLTRLRGDEATARALADSLYAELVRREPTRASPHLEAAVLPGTRLAAGWLRTVVAQEYVNQYRRTRRETSLEAASKKASSSLRPSRRRAHQPIRESRAATASELAALNAEERFLLAAYYLDRRTLAEIAKLLRVHESTISRKLDRATAALAQAHPQAAVRGRHVAETGGRSHAGCRCPRSAVNVRETLRQGTQEASFYKEKGESRDEPEVPKSARDALGLRPAGASFRRPADGFAEQALPARETDAVTTSGAVWRLPRDRVPGGAAVDEDEVVRHPERDAAWRRRSRPAARDVVMARARMAAFPPQASSRWRRRD